MSEIFNPYKMRVDVSQLTQPSWLAHDLMADFIVEDAWQLPIMLTADQPIGLVREALLGGLSNIQKKGVAGFLFKVRLVIGRILGWDPEPKLAETPPSGTLRERYATTHGLTADQQPNLAGKPFAPVYITENESLDELENATVQAGLHLGRVPLDDGRFMALMTIYVKPNGLFGRTYMTLIKPFRYLIVYPALMRMVKRRWEQFTV